jgi:nitrogen fixation/metabolism regulation signal transduction histidine kinase
MNESELSWEERDHLYKLCAIPSLIVLWTFIAYVVYLQRTDPLKNTWDFVIRLAFPNSIIELTAFFLTFEVLYHRRSGKTAAFHIKRFGRRMLSSLACVLPGLLLMCISALAFSETLGEFNATFLGIGVWVLILLIVTLKLRSRHLRKTLEQT